MKSGKNDMIRSKLKFLPLIICILLILFFFNKEITVQQILDYTPTNPILAALFILLFYALKSISFVFPILILQIATGHLFNMPIALLINFIGRAVTITIPYWIGRFSGSDIIYSLTQKYPQLNEITVEQKKSPCFLSFLLRTFCFLPGDAVSMYLGAIKIPFLYYFEGSIAGTTLGVILSTIFGASIRRPSSVAFWLSASLMTLMAIVSFIVYLKRKK